MNRICNEDALLVVIDIQEKLLPAMNCSKELEEQTVKLIEGMRILGIPIFVTQQYTKGLGTTTGPVAEALGKFSSIEKLTFSAMAEPEFERALRDAQRKTVILCGIESHICVLQTALDLLEQGYHVFVVQDCIGSRRDSDNLCSQARMTAEGAIMTTCESVLYEIMKGAKAEGFKAVSAIIK